MTASKISQPPSLPEALATTVIEPTRGWASLGLRDIWEYRELLMLLVWREIKGAYRQSNRKDQCQFSLHLFLSSSFLFYI